MIAYEHDKCKCLFLQLHHFYSTKNLIPISNIFPKNILNLSDLSLRRPNIASFFQDVLQTKVVGNMAFNYFHI